MNSNGKETRAVQILVYAFIVFVLFGCSWFGGSKSSEELIDLPPPRIIQSVSNKKPAKKEPGSLWSEDSKWNELYSVGPTRQPGDVITVKVTDSLKARIAQLVAAKTGKPMADIKNGGEPLPTPEPQKSNDRAPASTGAGKNDPKAAAATTAAATPGAKKPSLDTKAFEATILEIMPNGVYKIASNQGLKVGGPDEPYVSLEGNLREREVAADDTVSADSLLGTKLDLVDYNQPNVIPGDQAAKIQPPAK